MVPCHFLRTFQRIKSFLCRKRSLDWVHFVFHTFFQIAVLIIRPVYCSQLGIPHMIILVASLIGQLNMLFGVQFLFHRGVSRLSSISEVSLVIACIYILCIGVPVLLNAYYLGIFVSLFLYSDGFLPPVINIKSKPEFRRCWNNREMFNGNKLPHSVSNIQKCAVSVAYLSRSVIRCVSRFVLLLPLHVCSGCSETPMETLTVL